MRTSSPKTNGKQPPADISFFLKIPDAAIISKEFTTTERGWRVRTWNKEDPSNAVPQLETLTEMYRLVTEVTHDALWEWDFGHKELFWIDGGHHRLFDYNIENSLIPQAFWESLVHPDDLARILAGLQKIMTGETKTIWEDRYRFKKNSGEYAFVHDRGHIIYENDIPIRMIGATQDITEKVQLETRLEEERKNRQKELTTAAYTAQENERAMIGMELHDNLNQVLAVAKMYLQMEKTNKNKKDIHLEESIQLISTVIKQIRSISKNLVIPGTHIIGLFDNIRNLVHDLMQVHPVKIAFEVFAISENELDEKLQMNLFRIIQEQMNNVLKHARAAHVAIQLSRETNGINLVITDDGIGCDLSKKQQGVGIINIQSRAELYDGTVSIVSEPGKGYQLKVILCEGNSP